MQTLKAKFNINMDNKFKRHMFSIPLLLLFVALILNLILTIECYNLYKKNIALRMDPTEVKLKTSFYRNIRDCNEQFKIVIIGSSRAAQWSSFKVPNSCLYNLGMNGQTSAQLTLRAKDQLSTYHPDIVIIQVGTNDIKAISLFPKKKALIFNNYQNNIKSTINIARSMYSKIIITTIFPIPRVPLYRKPFWTEHSTNAIIEFNNFLTALANNDDIYVFDSYNLLKAENSASIDKRYEKDFLHINEIGYHHLNENLKLLITKIIEDKK